MQIPGKVKVKIRRIKHRHVGTHGGRRKGPPSYDDVLESKKLEIQSFETQSLTSAYDFQDKQTLNSIIDDKDEDFDLLPKFQDIIDESTEGTPHECDRGESLKVTDTGNDSLKDTGVSESVKSLIPTAASEVQPPSQVPSLHFSRPRFKSDVGKHQPHSMSTKHRAVMRNQKLVMLQHHQLRMVKLVVLIYMVYLLMGHLY
ncbi:hypothetical protein CANTEDRAFT_137022 [Yamadazyma tenuis ATCC 10573]|nr:uncharacterized protein CANTEDRAFT_137022 [Yamadazyma tenuis ATCC 10573]EGV60543.1 hypothetical protein CANTEDRAFT_137022 [Yamadazyma tenuis ATCC 10573]